MLLTTEEKWDHLDLGQLFECSFSGNFTFMVWIVSRSTDYWEGVKTVYYKVPLFSTPFLQSVLLCLLQRISIGRLTDKGNGIPMGGNRPCPGNFSNNKPHSRTCDNTLGLHWCFNKKEKKFPSFFHSLLILEIDDDLTIQSKIHKWTIWIWRRWWKQKAGRRQSPLLSGNLAFSPTAYSPLSWGTSNHPNLFFCLISKITVHEAPPELVCFKSCKTSTFLTRSSVLDILNKKCSW